MSYYRQFKRKSGYCPLCNKPVDSYFGGYFRYSFLQMKPCGLCNEKASSRNKTSDWSTKASMFKFNGQRPIIIRN